MKTSVNKHSDNALRAAMIEKAIRIHYAHTRSARARTVTGLHTIAATHRRGRDILNGSLKAALEKTLVRLLSHLATLA